MTVNPLDILREAIQKLPAMKYALGVAALLAVIAIAKIFTIDPVTGVIGCMIVLVFMYLLLVFSVAAKESQSRAMKRLALVMAFFIQILAAVAFFVFTMSALFQWPVSLPQLIHPPTPATPFATVIVGRVVTERQDPVHGVTVVFNSFPDNVITDTDGRFTYTIRNALKAYDLKVTAEDGDFVASRDVSIAYGQATADVNDLTLRLKKREGSP